ncbi:hypothetical protein AM2010_715 [Pelagerythrobacter marensis]|uniref:Uncharacterized protein n=1 Tax=Pelagerythrobacter marensis TaxID=543877 RepID=A0A0G3X8T8_9SPHN|nr:hypothetical protein AM2010_715 [Pelagerythrobacter marensis]
MTNEEFADLANPHSWLLTADSLHEQALDLWQRRGSGQLILQGPCGTRRVWSATERATVLLATFALENAIKAFLVYEHPHWVSNGKLSRQLTSHRLLELRAKSTIIPYRNRLTHVLEFFDGGIDSWARYPCALSAAESIDLPSLSFWVWEDYRRTMRAYGRRMEKLLTTGWKGPHGRGGTWDCKTWKFLQQEG